MRDRAAATLTALLVAALPVPGSAEVGGDDSFRYAEPQAAHSLRAAGLVGGYVGVQLLIYTLTPRPSDPLYDAVYTPWDKLAHGAVSYDANTFRTNMVAHPTMGTVMYLMARGSRVPTWEASLWTVAGSTTWELVEYHERASINDLVVTPLVGISLGEPLFQLGAHLDRSPPSTGRTVLSWIVSPFKKLNDLADGARPARGDPEDDLLTWAAAGGRVTEGGGERASDVRVMAGWRLVRDPDYGKPGSDVRAWVHGQVTAVSVDAAFGSDGISDGRLDSSTLLAALYARQLDEEGRGTDLAAGAGVAFELRTHRWAHSGQPDLAANVELPRVVAEARWLAGGLRLTGRLQGSVLFGASRSFALDGDPSAVPPEQLPTVQLDQGYHFGVGAGLRPRVVLALGPASLAAESAGEWLWRTSQRPDPKPERNPTSRLEERWGDASLRAAWRFAGGLELGADAAWHRRWSRANEAIRTASDRSLGFTVGWVGEP